MKGIALNADRKPVTTGIVSNNFCHFDEVEIPLEDAFDGKAYVRKIELIALILGRIDTITATDLTISAAWAISEE